MHLAGENILEWSKTGKIMSREEVVGFIRDNERSFPKDINKLVKKFNLGIERGVFQ